MGRGHYGAVYGICARLKVATPRIPRQPRRSEMQAERSCGRLVSVEVSLHEKDSSDSSSSVRVLCRTIGSSSGQFWNPASLDLPCLDPFRLFRARVLRQLRPRGLFRIVLQLSQCRLLRIFGRLLPVRDRLLSQLLQRQRLLSALLAAGLQQWLLSAWVLRPEILFTVEGSNDHRTQNVAVGSIRRVRECTMAA